jgi:hypothetical protein
LIVLTTFLACRQADPIVGQMKVRNPILTIIYEKQNTPAMSYSATAWIWKEGESWLKVSKGIPWSGEVEYGTHLLSRYFVTHIAPDGSQFTETVESTATIYNDLTWRL